MKGEALGPMRVVELAQMRQNLEGHPDIEEAAELMNLAGNPTRLKLLYVLEKMNEPGVNDLAEVLGMPVAAVARHLAKLKAHGLVARRSDSHTIYYRLTDHTFNAELRERFFRPFWAVGSAVSAPDHQATETRRPEENAAIVAGQMPAAAQAARPQLRWEDAGEVIFPSRHLTRLILGLEGSDWANEFVPAESSATAAEVADEIVADAALEFRQTLEFLLVRLAKEYRLKGLKTVPISERKKFAANVAREIVLALPLSREIDTILQGLYCEFETVIAATGFSGPWGEYLPAAKGIILNLAAAGVE